MQSPCVRARAQPSNVTPLYGKFLMKLKRALYLRLSLRLSLSQAQWLAVTVFCHRDGDPEACAARPACQYKHYLIVLRIVLACNLSVFAWAKSVETCRALTHSPWPGRKRSNFN
jgi:hypothetical protein